MARKRARRDVQRLGEYNSCRHEGGRLSMIELGKSPRGGIPGRSRRSYRAGMRAGHRHGGAPRAEVRYRGPR